MTSTNESASPSGTSGFGTAGILSYAVMAVWAVIAVILIVAPGKMSAALMNINFLVLILFGLVHGRQRFGTRGILFLLLASMVIAYFVEGLSINTGVPFGRYVHNYQYGFSFLGVPAITGPAYFGLIYLYWTLANGIHGDPDSARDLRWRIGTPILGGFVAVANDLCWDSLGGTLSRYWTYTYGGAYYGEPISAFFGWFILNWAVMQVFAIYQSAPKTRVHPVGKRYWYTVMAYWLLMAAQYPLLMFVTRGVSTNVVDNSGWTWRSSDIIQGSTLTAVFCMLPVALLFYLMVSRRYSLEASTLATGTAPGHR